MPLLQRLKAYYDFANVGIGGSGIDLSGFGNHLTNNGASGVAGIVGSGIATSKSDTNYMSIPVVGTPFRPGNTNWSMAFWARIRTKDPSVNRFITQYNANGNLRAFLTFYLDSTDRFGFFVSGDGLTSTSVDANNFGSPTTGEWAWIFVWHDAFNDEIGIQINDTEPDVVDWDGGTFASSPEPLVVGALLNTSQQYSDTDYDEFGFWHRILTPQERSDIYNAGIGNAFPFSETSILTGTVGLLNGLQSYWNFDEQGAATVREDLVDSNNLAPRGSPTLVAVPALVASGIETLHTSDKHLAGGASTNLGFASGNSFSIYALVQLNSPTNGGILLSKDHAVSGLRGYQIRYSGVSKRFQFSCAPGGSDKYRVVVSDTIDDAIQGPFYHLFAWYDRTDNSINLEVNGSGVNVTQPASGNSGVAVPMFVGKGFDSVGAEEFFPGIIDEIGVWDRALTGNERNTIYNDGLGLSFSNYGTGVGNTLWLFT